MSTGNKVKITFLSDTHLGFDYPVKPRIERRRRGEDFFRNFHRVLDGAVKSGADLVVHGGDLFFRSRVPAVIVDKVYGALFEFAGRGIPIAIVPGNHERSRLPESLYLAHPNIHVFVKPMTYTLEVKGAAVHLSGFPFERRDIKTRFPEILADAGWKDIKDGLKLLCLHQAVEGAQVGPSNYTFRNGDDVVKYSDLPPDCHAVLAGHIHRRQVLEGESENRIERPPVIYPGSIERTSFAEKKEEKGYYNLEFGPSDGKGWKLGRMVFCRLPARPMADLVLDGGVGAENIESYLSGRITGLHRDSIVRIRNSGRVSPDLAGVLTAEFLRRVFPRTMNVQLSADFRRAYKGKNQ